MIVVLLVSVMFYAAELEITEKKFLSKFSALKTSQVQ